MFVFEFNVRFFRDLYPLELCIEKACALCWKGSEFRLGFLLFLSCLLLLPFLGVAGLRVGKVVVSGWHG